MEILNSIGDNAERQTSAQSEIFRDKQLSKVDIKLSKAPEAIENSLEKEALESSGTSFRKLYGKIGESNLNSDFISS